jgi:Ca-activated chloride channel family protein
LRLRYKAPDADRSLLIEQPIARGAIKRELKEASADMRFAAAVAAFGQLLRGGKYTGDFNYDDAIRLAQEARGKDAYGYRGEFIGLLTLAKTLNR